MNINILTKEINKLKQILYMLIDEQNLTDEKVVKCSQKLDNLILEYQKQEYYSKIK